MSKLEYRVITNDSATFVEIVGGTEDRPLYGEPLRGVVMEPNGHQDWIAIVGCMDKYDLLAVARSLQYYYNMVQQAKERREEEKKYHVEYWADMALDVVKEWVRNSPGSDPTDALFEIADSGTPIMNYTIMRIAAEDHLDVDETCLGGDDDSIVQVAQRAIYNAIYHRLWGWWNSAESDKDEPHYPWGDIDELTRPETGIEILSDEDESPFEVALYNRHNVETIATWTFDKQLAEEWGLDMADEEAIHTHIFEMWEEKYNREYDVEHDLTEEEVQP